MFNLAVSLARHHSVTLITYAQDGEFGREPALFDILCSVCQLHVIPYNPPAGLAGRTNQLLSLLSPTPRDRHNLHTAAMQRAIDHLCEQVAFDVVQIEFSHMCSYRVPQSAALVLDEHNIEYELLQRMQESERSLVRRVYSGQEHRKVRRVEQALWHTVDACAVTSDREKRIIHEYAPQARLAVVPNGVDGAFFAPKHLEPEPETIVFTGLLKFRPNLDAVRFLVDDILPKVQRFRPKAQVTLVGEAAAAELTALRRHNVTVTGWVPDVRDYLARAAVVVAPLRVGSGTRLKVLEALAMGKPIVSTTLGCEGINVLNRTHLLVADGADAFAAGILELFSDPASAEAMGQRGRSLVLEQYSWDGAVARLEELYARAMDPGRES